MTSLYIHDGIRMYTVIVNADTNRVSSFYSQAVCGGVSLNAELARSTYPKVEQLQSHEATKPRSGKSGTVPVI